MCTNVHPILFGVHEFKKVTIIIFFWNFGLVPATQTFLCFQRLRKPTTFKLAVIKKPLFIQNVLGLILVLCIVFIADFFPWFHIERFQNNKFSQFCIRLGVIGRSVRIIINHAVDATFYIW